MKIVITNDDGFGEPGIEALQDILPTLGEVVVVAPKRPHSFAGHRVTMKEDIPVEQVDARKFVVDGTPADCTRLALKALAPDADWVVAGINPGANVGINVNYSGTVAAAKEAALFGLPALAAALRSGGDLSGVPGIVYRHSDGSLHIGEPALCHDPDRLVKTGKNQTGTKLQQCRRGQHATSAGIVAQPGYQRSAQNLSIQDQ